MRFQLGGLVVPFEDAGHHVYTKKKKLKCPVWVTRWQLGINQLQHIESLELLLMMIIAITFNKSNIIIIIIIIIIINITNFTAIPISV